MFIVLDAIDGAGKGRQRLELASFLSQMGFKLQTTEFPVHDAFYETVIHPCLQGEKKMNPASWVLAYLLDKTLNTDQILPFVGKKDCFFVADGYFTTTIAYQAFLTKQVSFKKLLGYGRDFAIPVPDLAIYLDVDPKVAMQRKQIEEGHDEGLDMFEKSLKKQQQLRKIYKDMVSRQLYCPWEEVDGSGKVEEVTAQIISVLKSKHYLS